MKQYKSKISRDDYLKALALFTVANDHYVQAAVFGEALNGIIMVEPERFPGGHVDELLYTDEKATVAHFDEALRREGIIVEEDPA